MNYAPMNVVLSRYCSEAEVNAELIGVLSFGLTLMFEEKKQFRSKNMLKELKVGVPHPNDS